MSDADSVVISGAVTEAPAYALADLLGTVAPELDAGRLPALWHWLFLQSWAPLRSLGSDGHPRDGIPHPPKEGMRRMFAGGRVTQHEPLRVGLPATRRTRMLSSTTKTGRSGELTFVTVENVVSQSGREVIVETQELVYRYPAPLPTASGPVPVSAPTSVSTRFAVDPIILFRLSALTFNSHRIHYDRDFAVGSDGYPDLVIHGPLQALLMSRLAEAQRPGELLAEFSYRLVAPAFGAQTLEVSAVPGADGVSTSVSDQAGQTTATGVADFLLPDQP